MNVIQYLKGKKTYIAAAIAALSALLGYLNGELGGADALELAATGIIGATLRAGIKTEAAKTV
ncbi:MAG TPA: hypothetical protein VGW34_09945 [Allosphingosinicella sp.]|nr:hypothetical protein [Allosphingosinicella sp.]